MSESRADVDARQNATTAILLGEAVISCIAATGSVAQSTADAARSALERSAQNLDKTSTLGAKRFQMQRQIAVLLSKLPPSLATLCAASATT